jgi:hypothetical protein
MGKLMTNIKRYTKENCQICHRPILCNVDFEPQCNECLAYEGRDCEYDIDYSDKSKLDKYQLQMIKVFGE